jgi:hypothetical protein
VDVEQGAERKQPNEFCLNCGTKLQDTFCHHCGQKDIPKRQTLGELWTNFISSFWSYEGKFFLTTRYLITKPGFLALEYNKGKRESYYHPARMYVFISFIFFLIFSVSSSSELEKVEPVRLDKEDIAELKKELPLLNIDSIIQKRTTPGKDTVIRLVERKLYDSLQNKNGKNKKNNGFSIMGDKYESLTAYDSVQKALSPAKRDGWFMRRLNIRAVELNKRYEDRSADFSKEFGQAFLDNFSKVLFFLLPVFALLLKLFYLRKDYFYSEHLVFSIYYYNFFYLAGSLQILCGYLEHIAFFDWARTIIGFWIFFYLLVAMKRMYNQSWKKTTLKFFIFSFLFMIFLAIGFTINALFLVFAI